MLLSWNSSQFENVSFLKRGALRAYVSDSPAPFTPDFIQAATASIRCPEALIEITWADAATDSSVVIVTNDVNRIDRTGQLFSGETVSGEKWAYIHDGLKADGSFKACPALDSEPQMGWYGNDLVSDGSGDFSTEPYIEVSHDARLYTQVTVAADDRYGEYPVDFTITFTHPGGPTQIVVTGNTDRVYENSFSPIASVTAVKLEISKWSAPNEIVKIVQFSGPSVILYDTADIVELNILEETNSDTGTVPIGNVSSNELDLAILNTDRRFSHGNTDSPYHDVLKSGRKIRVWLGFILPAGTTDQTGDLPGYIVRTKNGDKIGYMPYGVYWSKDWISSYKSQVTTTTAYDIAYRLSQKDFLKGDNYSGDVVSIINDILTEAKNDVPALEWTISPDIAGINWGLVSLPNQNYLEVLKDIAEATLSYSFVNRDGVLVVGSRLDVQTPVETWQELGLSEYFNFESQPKLDELINFIRVGYTRYTLGEPGTDLYPDSDTFEIPAGETSLKVYVEWSTQPVRVTDTIVSITAVSGAPVVSDLETYANGADLTVTGSPGDSFTIQATGRPFQLEENTETTTEDAESIRRYGAREFALTGNNLIRIFTQAKEIADELLTFYGGLRDDAAINWPTSTLLSVGSTAEVVEFKSDTVETKDFFLIKRQSTTFDGALRAQTELRRG